MCIRDRGGAIHFEYGTITISRTNFTQNRANRYGWTASTNDNGYGGALYVKRATLTVTDSNFVGNTAPSNMH